MLEISNLFVQYKGAGYPSVKDISFKMEKGDRIAILGPSGCGKTTLLGIISGMLGEKEAEIGGTVRWKTVSAEPVIRTVFQEATLLPWLTVEKNISFGLEAMKVSKKDISEKVGSALELVNLSDFAHSYPHQLSIGMQQRVNFARALVCEPDLLLLDEPFSALDPEMKKKLQEDFLKILEGKKITSIFVTHDIAEAVSMATKIIVLTSRPSAVSRIVDGGSKNILSDGGDKDLIENLEMYE